MRISDWSSDVCSSDLRLKQTQSHNVLALLPGSTRPDESVVYMAHWDHLGTHEGEAGDNIYNGARSEERRVGKECVRTCRSRSSQDQYKTKTSTHLYTSISPAT